MYGAILVVVIASYNSLKYLVLNSEKSKYLLTYIQLAIE